jgi:hypothetical protein
VEKITLSVNLVNQVLGYLGSRPYQEVFQMVDALQKEAQNQPKDQPIEVSVE